MRFCSLIPLSPRELFAVALGCLFVTLLALPSAFAQDADEQPAGPTAETPVIADDADTTTTTAEKPEGIPLFWLLLQGGWFMVPILLLLILVVAFAIERGLGLRRSKVMPNELIDGLGQLASQPGGFDPRKAYRLCQQYPSAASNVIRSMLLKVGRPHSEVEHTVQEASEREASRMYKNVGWLTMAAAVAPLMGLLGTVWGMIVAFHDFTQSVAGTNMGIKLAEGIYTALVTTFGGLVVAIPAAILAHFFEGRIRDLFLEIDELLFILMPQVERYEGRLRVSRQSLAGGAEEGPVSAKVADEEQVAAAPK